MEVLAGSAAPFSLGVSDAPRSTSPTAESPLVLNGRYELGAPLGEGGMGVVYRAIDRQHPDRALAVKCIRDDAVSDSALSLFKAEFKAMSEMRHPNVARVYDFERIQGSDDYLFTMELVDGANVRDVARHATAERIHAWHRRITGQLRGPRCSRDRRQPVLHW